MAVEMNVFRNKLVFVIVLLLTQCSVNIFVLASTTVPPTGGSTAPVGTESSPAPTLPASTVPTPQVQTTTPITATPSPIPVNTDLAYCPCDVTGNACDVNCCCDGDCTADDRLAFSECLNISVSTDDRLCMRSELILFDNSPYVSNYTSDELFCLYFDNNAARNYYTIPDLVTTEEVFKSYVKDYAEFSFEPSSPEPVTYGDYYKSGDEIYIVYDSRSQGKLSLPTALASTLCADGNPAAYLTDTQTQCIRSITSLATQCTSLPSLSASTYYEGFRVVVSPALFQKYVPTNDTNSTSTVNLDSVTDLYNNSYTVAVELGSITCKDETTGLIAACNISLPSYTSPTCLNTVLQTSYIIQHDGTKGITQVTVDILLGSISDTTNLHSQDFSVQFNGINDGEKFIRSGNPGYRQGEPLMAGVLNGTTDADGNVNQVILLNSNRDEWLTIGTSGSTGQCGTSDRLSVQFGQDIRSGCFLQISLANVTDYCELIQQRIINALEGDQAPVYDVAAGTFDSTLRYVATFGNSDPEKVGDWLPIQVQNRPNPSPAIGQRCSLSLGMGIQVLYAKVGSLTNAQSKILGVAFVYNQAEDVYYRCVGPYCQPGADLSQKLEITSSVTFIDVSNPAVGFEAEPPLFLAKVPYDFFYPFLTGTAPTIHLNLLIVLFVVLKTVCYL
ncbi:tectonic-3 [Patella vulgata]|uniref:tectonic-3 n=1 Tax=Patella vulgata TaxID=6465 RepID=UPI00217F3C45|nr:tectonic-3 [Patella vulgata]